MTNKLLTENETQTSLSKTEILWQELYQNNLGAPKFPNSHAVRWVFGHFSKEGNSPIKLLDMGTGAGRHAIMMAKEGFNVTGTDHSKTAVENAKTWCEKEGLNIDFQIASAEKQPFINNSFDGILCYGVLYYLSYIKFKLAVKEIFRLLKPLGATFVMVKNDLDVRKNKGICVTPHQYRIIKPDKGWSWNNELGMELTLLPKSEIIEIFSNFSELRIEQTTSTLGNGKYLESAWLIYARK